MFTSSVTFFQSSTRRITDDTSTNNYRKNSSTVENRPLGVGYNINFLVLLLLKSNQRLPRAKVRSPLGQRIIVGIAKIRK